MTYNQYTSNGRYSSPSQSTLNDKIPLFSDYVQLKVSDSAWILVTGKSDDCIHFTDCTVHTVDSSSYVYTYTVEELDSCTVNWDNEYYIYSSLQNSYYNKLELNEALSSSIQGFALTGGIAICVILVFLSRLFSRHRR